MKLGSHVIKKWTPASSHLGTQQKPSRNGEAPPIDSDRDTAAFIVYRTHVPGRASPRIQDLRSVKHRNGASCTEELAVSMRFQTEQWRLHKRAWRGPASARNGQPWRQRGVHPGNRLNSMCVSSPIIHVGQQCRRLNLHRTDRLESHTQSASLSGPRSLDLHLNPSSLLS
jgi:hypothetical protein